MNKRILQKIKNKKKKNIKMLIGSKDIRILKKLREIGIINGITKNNIRRNTRIKIKNIKNTEYYLRKERKKKMIEKKKYNEVYILKNKENKYSEKLKGGKLKIRIKL